MGTRLLSGLVGTVLLLLLAAPDLAARSPAASHASKPPKASTSHSTPKAKAPKAPKPAKVKAVHTSVHTTKPAKRSKTARSAFERSTPCPATGKTSGKCPGYVVDHVRPLACSGADGPGNMQWQTVEAAKRKDSSERAGCS